MLIDGQQLTTILIIPVTLPARMETTHWLTHWLSVAGTSDCTDNQLWKA
jgi:hypothetical protein